MVYNLRDKDKESTESSAMEEAPNEPPNQEQMSGEEGVTATDNPADNMDPELEQYLKGRGM